MLLRQRFQIHRPLEEMEVALVRAATQQPQLLDPPEEAVLRTALSLARLYKVRHEGRDVGVGASLVPFREQVERRLKPLLLRKEPPSRIELLPQVHDLRDQTLRTRDAIEHRFGSRVPKDAIDHEVRHKSLVLVSGGGGGTGYVYVGAMSLLDEFGLTPSLLVGTSIGAILSLFRSRIRRFDQAEIVNIVRGLSWSKLFRFVSTENRYGLPAAMRLFLRAGIGRYFHAGADGQGLRLSELPVPIVVAAAGIRRGMLPRPVAFYERLVQQAPGSWLNPAGVARWLPQAVGALTELLRPDVLVKVHLGADAVTRQYDALDAVGFSSSLPGFIHYDVLRDDPRMRELLDSLFAERGIFRLIDGGLVDNLPCKAAWRAVHKGLIGTRNAFILALNGFAPRLSTPLWLPLQQLAERNVAHNRPYAHCVKDFRRTLSPLELVPSVESLLSALELGRAELAGDVPFLTRMLAPLPRL